MAAGRFDGRPAARWYGVDGVGGDRMITTGGITVLYVVGGFVAVIAAYRRARR